MRGIPSLLFSGGCKEESPRIPYLPVVYTWSAFFFFHSRQQASLSYKAHLSISASLLQKHHISPHIHSLPSTPQCCRLVYAPASSLPAAEELFNAIITALCGPSFRRQNSFQGLQSIQIDNMKHLGPPNCSGNQ